MARVQPAGERPEGGKDQLASRRDEAAAGDLAAAMVDSQLGMEMAGQLGPRLGGVGLVAKEQAVHFRFLDDRRRRNGRRFPDRGCR